MQSSLRFQTCQGLPVTLETILTRSQHNAISRRVGPGDRQSAALSVERKTRMGQQGCWHKGLSGQGCHVIPAPKGRRAERRHRATRGVRAARHRAPPVGESTKPFAGSDTTYKRHPRSLPYGSLPADGIHGLYSIRHNPQATALSICHGGCLIAEFTPLSNLPGIACNTRNHPYPQPAQCKRSRRVGPGDRHSAALSRERKTRMGQQGGWHKGMPGQGCPVMSGPKGRRAERRNRATRGVRTARHRAPPVGESTRPLASQAPSVGDITQPSARLAQGTTRRRRNQAFS